MQGTQVWSLVRQLRSHMLGSAARQSEKRKKKTRQERDAEAWTSTAGSEQHSTLEIVWRYSWWDLLIGLMWAVKGRGKSQDDSKLFGLRTQKDDVPHPQYLPAHSLLSWVFCLSVSLSSEAFFDHVQQSSRLLTHVQFSLLRKMVGLLFPHPVSLRCDHVTHLGQWNVSREDLDFTIFRWNP